MQMEAVAADHDMEEDGSTGTTLDCYPYSFSPLLLFSQASLISSQVLISISYPCQTNSCQVSHFTVHIFRQGSLQLQCSGQVFSTRAHLFVERCRHAGKCDLRQEEHALRRFVQSRHPEQVSGHHVSQAYCSSSHHSTFMHCFFSRFRCIDSHFTAFQVRIDQGVLFGTLWQGQTSTCPKI